MLRTHSGFLPKVPSLANIEKKIEFAPYGIAEDGTELPERSLCVCRVLGQYLQVTKDFRKSSQLFVTFGPKNKGQKASKATLARWVKDAIQLAYEAVGETPPEGIKAHSTRHASASWADLKGVSVLDICQQANWTTPHTFLKHYKLDLSNSVSALHANTILDSHK
jgi:integrase